MGILTDLSCLDPVRRVRAPTADLPAASMDFADIEEAAELKVAKRVWETSAALPGVASSPPEGSRL